MKITNFKNKKWTDKQKKLYNNAEIIDKEKFEHQYNKDKKYCKVTDHCHYTGEYRGDAHGLCELNHSLHKEIPIFHNESNFDYHFIIKELAFDTRFDKKREETKNAVSYIL